MTQSQVSGLVAEAHAHALEGHPDYRVIRRLPIRTEYAKSTGQALLKGVIVDTETTGLDQQRDKIVQLAMLVFEFDPATGQVFRVLDRFEALEDPGLPIPPGSSRIHGITDTMVAGQQIDDAVVASHLDGVSLVIAHNAAFDRPLLEARFSVFVEQAWACSLDEINWDAEGFGARKLDYLGFRLGFFFDGHHALEDCQALLEILQHDLPTFGLKGLKALFDHHAQKSYRIWARRSPFETKDALKGHGYRWDAEQKCWHKNVSGDDIKPEVAWLKEAVYGGRSVELDFEVYDAYSRYSARGGRVTKKSI